MPAFTNAISILALFISAATAWLTLFRKGTIKMTQPTVIYFGPDKPVNGRESPKIYPRALLFSTSKRGRVIESMHATLYRNESHQNFNIWVYGEERLVRGSGLFVGETGLAADHHFLTPMDGTDFRFVSGHYRVEIFAKLLGDSKPILLFSQNLEITNELAVRMREPDTGLYFDWGPDSSRYLPHVDKKASSFDPQTFIDLVSKIGQIK